ncbi:TatA/E family twin arginine-targeting protein translocase [cf. Phormidesmis sp. LEGE 11477]|uniref:TatA/E family twin arginine-targeting protein translocase n=1 Tax=cf. Phormidesmis sp. LEGE 11477 TaxID=1828680 RepID=UPI00187EE092|nr:TatA/E family twin arginine-targeting protein translocase [cf. Phormidesmis sp. LEGE 11477]MBE9060102.1 TatA/E family twin arginine-targeting protein translocase [cf. Phormidesmis sp. LEGE 11477]
MNIFGIGLPEMGLIMIVALLVFGPKKLPEIGRSLGKAMKGFQDATKEFETEFKKEAERIEQTVEPMKATLEGPRAISQGQKKASAPNQTPNQTVDEAAIPKGNQTSSQDEPTEAEIVEASNNEADEKSEADETKVAETVDESQPA